MEKAQRGALASMIKDARFLLEDEVQEQLEGTYNILPDGTIEEEAPGDPLTRGRLLELIEHFKSTEPSTKAAVARARRELAFTTLNRFVALKLAEARGLVRECVSRGPDSVGIRELADCAPGLRRAHDDRGYRLLLETVMDEQSLGVGALFDRRAAGGLLWPRPPALRELLGLLNDESLEEVWSSDETIGWIYQYFNANDVKKMRDASSKGPRNCRELAVRNQFFTPRYVVEFLTDNTLGRIWDEMQAGDTGLRERCDFLLHTPTEASQAGDGGSREPKDPRELRVLDPACGSGHFLLYAFDLLLQIYMEAWEREPARAWGQSGSTLREDYASREALKRATPALILHHNLYGIEIDPRCAQIASFALWLRAQRAWDESGVPAADRPAVRRTHIVVAEPIPEDEQLLAEFQASLEPPELRDFFSQLIEEMQLACDLGSLLRVERSIEQMIKKAQREGAQGSLFSSASEGDAPWHDAEDALLAALAGYASEVSSGPEMLRRRMFADDAEQGVALIDVLRARYDVVLMNPPFGDPSLAAKKQFKKAYPRTKNDILAAFVERGLELLHPGGRLGAITSRTGFFLSSFTKWREEVLLEEAELEVMADLGLGVMDDAMVEAAAYCLKAQ